MISKMNLGFVIVGSFLFVSTSYGKVTYLHSNPIGSIVAATDEIGAQVWTKRYTPYGIEVREGESNDSGVNNGFATHELDSETKLMYMKARYYDSFVGRFYSSDRFEDGYSYYAYSGNNPVNFYDPSGNVRDWGALFTQSVGLVASGVGMIGGVAFMGSGVIGIAAPEPLSSAAGAGLFSLGLTSFAFGVDGMSENMSDIMNNIMETDYSLDSSLKSDIASLTGIDGDSPLYNAAYDSVGLAMGLKDPSKLVKMPSYLESIDDLNTMLETSEHMYNSYDSISGSMGWSYSPSWGLGGGSSYSFDYGSSSSGLGYSYSY